MVAMELHHQSRAGVSLEQEVDRGEFMGQLQEMVDREVEEKVDMLVYMAHQEQPTQDRVVVEVVIPAGTQVMVGQVWSF